MAIPNQAPDSSVAGFLQPTQPEPSYQLGSAQPLEDYLQQFVAGVAGLDSTLVRPRWQPEPPNLPDYGTDWAACGITQRRPIGPYGGQIHYGSGDSLGNRTELQRHEEFDLLVSFYGPDCDAFASNLGDGVQIWQNRSLLRFSGLAFVEAQETLRLPELIKNRWTDRADKTLVLRRIIRRNYPVLDLASAAGWVLPDPGQPYQAPFDTANIPRVAPPSQF